MSYLCMLESQCEQLTHAFQNSQTGLPKSVDCIRVDGASDEGPSHEEVQYWWTERHILKQKVATIVTTRSSGCSYLNRVELQNGCLSLGHAHTFIPSTLGGSCYNQQQVKLMMKKLERIWILQWKRTSVELTIVVVGIHPFTFLGEQMLVCTLALEMTC